MTMGMHERLLAKDATMSVVGLGYVGLPIALAFAKHLKVIGFDINAERVALMKQQIDPSEELEAADFDGCDITFTADPEDLKKAQFHIVAVPTPINPSNQPDLTPLLSASRTVGQALKMGDYVVYESTVYPGCTEDDCVPVLEEVSGLKFGSDFKVGYSPERINPGDKVNTIETIVKVVSGSDEESLDAIARTYELVVKAGTHRASSIKVAEASKIINSGRYVNDAMGAHVGKQTVKRMLELGKNPLESRVLVMGLTFKEDVADIRNTKVVDVIHELQSYNIEVDVVDPMASPTEVKREYDLTLKEAPDAGAYDAVIIAVNHAPYRNMSEKDFEALMRDEKGVLIDLKGLYRNSIKRLTYWSL